MSTPHILDVASVTEWYCPSCGFTDAIKTIMKPHARMHPCPKHLGWLSPMVLKGVKAKVVMHEREDYIGKEMVQRNADGRPVMSMETVRDDGTDLVVFAPTATAKGIARG